MTSLFLEERLPVNVRIGASYIDQYAVTITRTSGGAEYRKLVNPFPIRTFTLNYTLLRDEMIPKIQDLYHRAFGMLYGFRVKCFDDYTTAQDGTSPPTAFDQGMGLVAANTYQLQKSYGFSGAMPSIGYARRFLYKPIASTVKAAVGGVPFGSIASSTTGLVNLVYANFTGNITAITKATQAVITVGAHTFNTSNSVVISGVLGMTQINGLRGAVVSTTATTITVNLNTTGFSTYTSGGTAKSAPQSGEVVTAGCEFDLPCRFNSHLESVSLSKYLRDCGSIEIIELLNP